MHPLATSRVVAEFLASTYQREVVSHSFGSYFEVSAKEAWEISAVTGATYCDNFIFPLSIRPFTKIFGSALSLEFTSGLFDQAHAKYTPEYLADRYPFLIRPRKKILVVNTKNENHLKEIRREIVALPDGTDYILLRLDETKRGLGLEPILELAFMKTFKAKGFIVENQVPLSAAFGSPDVLAFHDSELLSLLDELLSISDGQSLIDYQTRRLFAEDEQIKRHDTDESPKDLIIVGEAKVGGARGKKQVSKYLSSGFFDLGIELHDDCRSSTTGLIHSLGVCGFTSPLALELPDVTAENKNKTRYRDWLRTVVCMNLLVGFGSSDLGLILEETLNVDQLAKAPNALAAIGHAKFILNLSKLALE